MIRDKYREDNPQCGRYIPSDSSFFQALSEAYDSNASEDTIKALALREVAKSSVDPSLKVELFIPAPKLTTIFSLEDVLASLHRENQTDVWTASLPHVCDFVCVRGRGIKFHCNDRDIAIKLGGSAIRCLGKQLQIQPYRQYGEWYYVDLRNVPIGVGDLEIFDYFKTFNVQFGIAPYVHQGPLQSRDRTIWFRSKQAPAALFSSTNQPLREIFFPGHEHPVFVHHKHRALNKVTPPSLVVKQASTKPQSTHYDLDAASATQVAALDSTQHQSQQEPRVTFVKPSPSAPFEEWITVSHQLACKTPPIPTASQFVEVVEEHNDNQVHYTFPVYPTQYQLAFHPLDDDNEGDSITCEVIVDNTSVRGNPLYPSDTISRMLEQHCMLQNPKVVARRSGVRRHIKAQQVLFMDETEPETRLAIIAAQPSAIAPALSKPSPRLSGLVTEHAIMRAICAAPDHTFGDSDTLMDRLQTHYGADIPPHTTLLETLLPSHDAQTTAHALALFDLYLRSSAASIYMDPLQIATLADAPNPSRIWRSHFLLWDDLTLLALASSSFGSTLIEKAPPHISAAIGVLACFAANNESMEEASSSSYDSDTHSNSMQDPCR